MLSGISAIVLVGIVRRWLRSYRGMSPPGVVSNDSTLHFPLFRYNISFLQRRHVKGSLVTLTRIAASAEGLLQMG